MNAKGRHKHIPRHFSDEEIAEVVERYRLGETAREIAAATGVSKITVFRWARSAGVRKRSPRVPPSALALSEKMIARGMAIRRIAKILGISPESISNHLHARGLIGGRR